MATPTFVARIKQGFESSAYKTPEFKKWATQAKRWVTAWCKENGAEMVDWHVGHFEVSAFLRRKDGEFVYINSCDVRSNLMNAMLVRAAAHQKDYQGGHNNWAFYDDTFALQFTRLVNGVKFVGAFVCYAQKERTPITCYAEKDNKGAV